MCYYGQENYTTTCSTWYWVLNLLQVIVFGTFLHSFTLIQFFCQKTVCYNIFKPFETWFPCSADSCLDWGNCIWGSCLVQWTQSNSFHRRRRERFHCFTAICLLCLWHTCWRSWWHVGTRRRIRYGSTFSRARSPTSG